MRISVAMATYNGERFISEQLSSLAQQTLHPHELVVSDDGSADSTLKIVEQFASSAPFPVLILRNSVNVGFTLNFFRAAARCSGDLLAFCDQDNIWLPHKLERCAEIFRDQEIVLAVHTAEVIDGDGTLVGQRLRPFSRVGKLGGQEGRFDVIPQGCSMVLRRCVFERVWNAWPAAAYSNFGREHGNLFGHDTLSYCAAKDLGHIYNENEPLVRFRVHTTNTTAARGAFGARSVRIRYAFARSCRAEASDYRRIAQAYRIARVLIMALCKRGGLPSFEELQRIWRRAGGNMELRAELYEKRGVRYWTSYLRMLARGSYARRSKGGLGAQSGLKDAVRGCLMPAVLRPRPKAGDSERMGRLGA